MRIVSFPLKKAIPLLILGLPFFLLLFVVLAVGLALATLWMALFGKRKSARLRHQAIWEHARWFETGKDNAPGHTREVKDIEVQVEDPRKTPLKLIPGGQKPPFSGEG
jgi:hypothetical protein